MKIGQYLRYVDVYVFVKCDNHCHEIGHRSRRVTQFFPEAADLRFLLENIWFQNFVPNCSLCTTQTTRLLNLSPSYFNMIEVDVTIAIKSIC